MSIGVVDRKMLWGRAANRCAWETCSQRLTADLRSPETALLQKHGAVIGEEAHIRSGRPGGPRHDPDWPLEDVDSYANLVLLCPTHHSVIDKDNGAGWSTEDIVAIKARHESLMDEASNALDRERQHLVEALAARLEIWESMCGLSAWEDFTLELNSVYPRIQRVRLEKLLELGAWLLRREWPDSYPKISAAFENFRRVLSALLEVIDSSCVRRGDRFEIDRPHQRIDWNPGLYTKLLSELNIQCHAIWILVAELTRSVNLVIRAVTHELDPFYRFDDGYVLLADGDLMSGITVARLEFDAVDWAELPFSYSVEELQDRLRVMLDGGDPRNSRRVGTYSTRASHLIE